MEIPQDRAGWAALSDEELFEKAFSGQAGVAGHEISRRLIVALRESTASAKRAAAKMLFLTIVLVVLTVVTVWDILAAEN